MKSIAIDQRKPLHAGKLKFCSLDSELKTTLNIRFNQTIICPKPNT